MTPLRLTVARAVQLAGRRIGISAGELADVSGISLRHAQGILQGLASDGILETKRPPRKGKVGSRRITYKLVR